MSHFKLCSTCKKPIAFSAKYFVCSVSTCQRPRTGFFFCSEDCWDAHVPIFRHKDAWAEEKRSPETHHPLKASSSDDDILIVVSKMKAYIRERSGMNTSDSVAEVLSKYVRRWCDGAMESAKRSSRQTVLDRDL